MNDSSAIAALLKSSGFDVVSADAAATAGAKEKAEREKAEAARNRLAREQKEREKAETKVTALEPTASQPAARAPVLDEGALFKEIKKELKRVGCYEGAIDDHWKSSLMQAPLGRFGKFATFHRCLKRRAVISLRPFAVRRIAFALSNAVFARLRKEGAVS